MPEQTEQNATPTKYAFSSADLAGLQQAVRDEMAARAAIQQQQEALQRALAMKEGILQHIALVNNLAGNWTISADGAGLERR